MVHYKIGTRIKKNIFTRLIKEKIAHCKTLDHREAKVGKVNLQKSLLLSEAIDDSLRVVCGL